MRYRPKIDDHDFQFKTRHVREFVESGSKVKVFVMFRGREMAYTEFGGKILDRVAQELSDVSVVEVARKLDGRNMTMVLAPKPGVIKKAKKAKVDQQTEQKPDRSQVAPVESE